MEVKGSISGHDQGGPAVSIKVLGEAKRRDPMAPKKAKKTLGKKDMKKTKGGVIAIIRTAPAIIDGTSNTIMPGIAKKADGSV
jgi:hypothetical protein